MLVPLAIRVNDALYCLLHRFLFISGCNAWWTVYNDTYFFPWNSNRNLSDLNTTASVSNSPIEKFISA